MKVLANNRKKIYINDTLLLITINFLVLVLLSISFYPSLKSDDYYLAEISYGVYSGEYDIHLIYNNIIIGYILKGLLTIFPNIAWFTVLQIFILFCAFVSLSKEIYISFERRGIWIWILIIFFFGYEGYIKITFSKTAGFLIAIGFFIVFKNCIYQISYNRIILGILYVMIGVLYRSSMLEMVLAIFIGIVGIDILFQKKKGRFWGNYIVLMIIIVLILGGRTFLDRYNQYQYSLDEHWKNYFYDNNVKSNILDHGVMDYEKNREEFERINISENDLYMVYKNFIYDPEDMSIKKQEQIKEIVEKNVIWNQGIEKVVKPSSIIGFFRNVIRGYLKYPWFLVLFIFLGLVITYFNYRGYLYFMYAVIVFLAENYYLYVKGRYLQSHVDVSICFTIVLLCLFFISTEKCDIESSRAEWSIVILTIFVGIISSNSYYYSKYYMDYGSEQACVPETSKKIIEEINDDKDNLYITSSDEDVLSVWCFDAYENMPKSYLSNVFSMGKYRWYSHSKVLENYDVENPLKEMINSEKIYFMVSDYNEQREIQLYTTYIQEHYDKKAKFKKVKEVETLNVYRCVSDKRNTYEH